VEDENPLTQNMAEPKPPTPEYASFEEVADGTQNNQDEEK
jgi:hypothetical protein